MKKILLSFLTIGIVSASAFGATKAFFSDTEKSVGNIFTTGTIDISVAGQNPWNRTYPMLLDKPSQVNYINFTIQNVGNNDANVWKRINNVKTDGGAMTYHCTCGGSDIYVSSEPECFEGTNSCTQTYVERDDLDSYMVYNLYFCKGQVGIGDCAVEGDPASGKPTGNGWTAIIPEDHEVRVDNVNGVWIKLNDTLAPGEKLAISQSYHLAAWKDAAEPEITNWAQGDTMTFDIELEARQTTAPAPGSSELAILELKQKDPVAWDVVSDGASGVLTYNTSGSTFNYSFTGTGLQAETEYSLIYYADPYPGNNPGKLIDTMTTDGDGAVFKTNNVNLDMDLPSSGDANYPAGAKIWLVPSNRYNSGTNSIIGWNPTEYLFEMNLITYEDTDL